VKVQGPRREQKNKLVKNAAILMQGTTQKTAPFYEKST
jgi:hypothetical protein